MTVQIVLNPVFSVHDDLCKRVALRFTLRVMALT